MGPKPRTPENNDLFRQRLDELEDSLLDQIYDVLNKYQN